MEINAIETMSKFVIATRFGPRIVHVIRTDARTLMIDLSVRGKGRVLLGTLAGTLFCVLAAVIVDVPNFAGMTPAAVSRALTVDIMLPTLLAGPLLLFLLGQARALAIARDEMTALAMTDSLTGVLNRGAFTLMVEAYLAQVKQSADQSGGSLLMIDADHFKSINDAFGHAAGDEALRGIAQSIKSLVRPTDLVGRLGGEEFGVFLPMVTGAQALSLAERIRATVRSIPFASIDQNIVSVSIGGVSFHSEGNYERLFKIADQRLYLAKDSGRDQVSMANYIGSATC